MSEENLSFVSEIQEMMYGLGDGPKPLESTAKVIEEIVLDQMNCIICQAEEISNRRGTSIISPQDFLFLMRKDVLKLQRLINYLALKDQKSVFNNGISFTGNGEVDVDGTSYTVPMHSNRSQICRTYLLELGIEISADPSKQVFDQTKHTRQVRADWISQTLNAKQYLEYTKSRRASFYSKFKKIQKFMEWISTKHGENVMPKLKASTYDILVFVAKEIIAQILDLVFLLRQDRMVTSCNPYSKAAIANINSTSGTRVCGSYNRVESLPSVTPEEVREVVRRYWSHQMLPFSIFSRISSGNTRNKIMAFS